MSSALIKPDLLPPPAPPLPDQFGTFGALGLGMLADIAAGLASSFRAAVRAEPFLSFMPEARDVFEEIEWEGGDLRRFARLLHTPAYEAWLIAWEAAADPAPLRTLPVGTGEGRQLPATRVHQVWNPGPGRAVSVHVYSPPLNSMTFYDDRPAAFLVPLRTDAVEGAPEPGGAR